jgi:lipid-A-disaccharide synthase
MGYVQGKMSLVWIVAGESSGDARAAELMRAMASMRPGVRFAGAGGPTMRALAGEPFDEWIAESAVLGLWDVLRHYGYFRAKFHAMLGAIARLRPDAVVLVDYPGFNLRLARALRRARFPGKILCYISPQVWAWNRGRIPKIARLLDVMICVFPFEKPMYEAGGLRTVFAGHPLLESLAARATGGDRRERDLLALLPGSRKRELQRNLPVMLDAARMVTARRPGTRVAVAVAGEEHAAMARRMAGGWPVGVSAGGAHDLMERARAGIVCSGTATLEAAFFGMPYCLIYKTAWLTFQIGVRLVSVPMLGIVNILNNYRVNPPSNPSLPAAPAPPVVREFVQHLAQPHAMAEESLALLDDESRRTAMLDAFRQILDGLEFQGASGRAARAVLETIGEIPGHGSS